MTTTPATTRQAEAAANLNSTFHMSAELLPKFSGCDSTYPVTRWVEDVESSAVIYGWSPLQQLLVAQRALTGTAGLWLRAERPYKCWEDLKTAISKEFPDTVDVKAIHEMMSTRKKHKNETCMDYLLVMKEMGKRGKMPDYVAIQYVVDGIVDSEVYKTMLYGVRTYPELKEKLKIYETIREKIDQEKRENRQPTLSSFKKSTRSRCYNCGELNHVSSECPYKTQGRKCFRCNEFGHVATACKNDKSSLSSSTKPRNIKQGSQQQSLPKETYFNSAEDGRAMHEGLQHEEVGHLQNDIPARALISSSSNGGHYDGCEENVRQRCQRDVCNVNNNELRKKPMKEIKLQNGLLVMALIDSGSDVNLISNECYVQLGLPKCGKDNNIKMSGLGSSTVFSTGYFKTSIDIDNHKYFNVGFHIVPQTCMPFKVILGQDFLKNVLCVLNGSLVWMRPIDEEWLGSLNCFPCVSDCVGYIGSEQLKGQIISCIESYEPKQIKEVPIEVKIVLRDDTPIAQRPRRISFAERDEVDRQVAEWLANGIIRVSYSDYASPLVLVRKKDGSTRICVDYRQLNKKMVKDEFPLPLIEDYIDRLSEAKVFSVLYLKNGLFHLKVSEDSVKYTSFVTHNGQYEFLRDPFGLPICPKYFMRYISYAFRDLIAEEKVMIFIDDISIPAEDEHQALERLKEVLEVTSQYGMQFSWKKANLVCRSITYLGHVIEDGNVRPSNEKTEAVMKFPEPTTMTLNKKDLGMSTRVARRILFLQDFDFTIEHREGSRMRHSDALSRNPYVAVVNELFDSLRKGQQADEGLKAIINILKTTPHEDYLLDNGLVYKGNDKKLVIPRSMEDEIIKRVHQNGHFTKKKMLELISKDYFIQNVSKKVENYLVTCIPCLIATRKYNKKRKKSTKYEEGGRVAIRRTQFRPGLKLKPKFIGPYRITKVKRNDRYDVEKDDITAEGPLKTSCSADGMKKWPENV